MRELWLWLTAAGLGMYHGVNPAMGWLFAVALGLHHGRRSIVAQSLIPIAIGHLLAIAAAAAAVLVVGVVIDRGLLMALAGGALILWALYHLVCGSRHRVSVGMRAGFAALLTWSFLMASGHGAGLMLVPALLPLCLAGGGAEEIAAAGPLAASLAAIAIHTAAMATVSGMVAMLVYDRFGLGFLRRGWINFDWLWTGALSATGVMLLASC